MASSGTGPSPPKPCLCRPRVPALGVAPTIGAGGEMPGLSRLGAGSGSGPGSGGGAGGISSGAGSGAVVASAAAVVNPKSPPPFSYPPSTYSVAAFPSGYGFVVLTAIGSVMLVTWKSIKVGQARQEHKIPYPALYSPDNMAFNCIQRAHQNTMENLPQFLALLLIGGLEMPYFCTLGGIIWIMGRIAYAKGYYTGDPRKRSRGAFGILGMLMLLAATTKFAFRHLRG